MCVPRGKGYGKRHGSRSVVAALGGSHERVRPARSAVQDRAQRLREDRDEPGQQSPRPASGLRRGRVGPATRRRWRADRMSVLTRIGVRVPDVAWASSGFLARHGDTTPFPQAPEICVEIVSPNSSEEMRDKTGAYLAAGAREVWVISEDGSIRFFAAAGERASSRYAIKLDPPRRLPGSDSLIRIRPDASAGQTTRSQMRRASSAALPR